MPRPNSTRTRLVFNLTETAEGAVRPLQPRELYRTQQYARAVYRSELAARLTALGYEVERGRSGQPEISGYSSEYLDASSPRRQQIEAYLAEADRTGAAAAQIAAHQTREGKLDIPHEEMQRRHQRLAEEYGNQPTKVIEAAEHHRVEHARELADVAPRAVNFARDRNLEREAVVEERAILRDALQRSLGEARIEDLKAEIDLRVERGEFLAVEHDSGAPGRSFTTPAMIQLEQETIDRMPAGQGQHSELATESTREAIGRDYDHLNQSQRVAVQEILASRDQVTALEGAAGTGKTTALAAVRDAAEREGYEVEGFAPTSRAAYKLSEAASNRVRCRGIWRARTRKHQPRVKSTCTSSMNPVWRVRNRCTPFCGALARGPPIAHRRRSPAPSSRCGSAVSPASGGGDPHRVSGRNRAAARSRVKGGCRAALRGEVHEAVERLDRQGRVHEIGRREDRLNAVANEYANDPRATLVVSPDNQSRQDLNDAIHRAMQREGHVDREEHWMPVLVPRREITAPIGNGRNGTRKATSCDTAGAARCSALKLATTRASSASMRKRIRSP
jgi:hypothetical protein